jgi:hypothetical protein
VASTLVAMGCCRRQFEGGKKLEHGERRPDIGGGHAVVRFGDRPCDQINNMLAQTNIPNDHAGLGLSGFWTGLSPF